MSDTYGADAPLVPASVPSPDVSAPAQTSGLADNWRNWMSDPHNRAAMIQFGVALSQPIGAGQNALGQIGGAFGQAGEATDRVTAEQRAEAEAGSKQELRKAQAEGQESKADAAGTRALYQQSLLEFKRQGLDSADQARIAQAYQRHLNAVIAENKDIVAKNIIAPKNAQRPLKDPMTPEEFAKQFRGMGLSGDVAPVTGPTSAQRSPEDQQALEWATANPNDPRAAAIKRRLGVQ